MRSIAKLIAPLIAAAALAVPLQSSAAEPAAPERYSALEGVEAQPLTAAEMDAIHGALTGQDMYNALVAKASLIQDPVLREKTLAYLDANQAKLVAYFDKLLSFFRR